MSVDEGRARQKVDSDPGANGTRTSILAASVMRAYARGWLESERVREDQGQSGGGAVSMSGRVHHRRHTRRGAPTVSCKRVALCLFLSFSPVLSQPRISLSLTQHRRCYHRRSSCSYHRRRNCSRPSFTCTFTCILYFSFNSVIEYRSIHHFHCSRVYNLSAVHLCLSFSLFT